MAAPSLLVEQYQYDDTGVLMNGDVVMPFIDISSVDGLDNAPFRQSTHDREGMDGGFVDVENESLRTVTIAGTVYALTNALETYLDSLRANFAPTKVVKPFYFQTDHPTEGARLVYGKSLGIRFSKDARRRLGIVEFQVQIICEDPRIYSVPLLSQNLPGTLTLTGNRDSSGTITINGPRTNPSITLGSSTINFSAYSLATGESIVIDLYNKTMMQGVTSVRSQATITGGWPVIKNGDNVFTVGGTGTGTITAAARSAWR